jgi:hypothetical protein
MKNDTKTFVLLISDLMAANGGKIPASVFFEIGRGRCGMTCKEVIEARAKFYPETVRTVNRKKKAAKKTIVKKVKTSDEPKPLSKALKTAMKSADESHGVVENDGNSFVWIASPEEIANPSSLHETSY